MNSITVVIIGEKDWAHYSMDIGIIKNVGNNLKTFKTETMVSELGDILNTANRAHKDKEAGDYTVPNLLAAYIYRTGLLNEVLEMQEQSPEQTLLFGCFRTKSVDGKEGFRIREAGMFSGALESEEQIMSTFWASVQKFRDDWLKDEYHPNGTFHKMFNQFCNAAA